MKSLEVINGIYMNKIYMAVWNKIYSLTFLNEHNIRFDESLWYAEGMHFNIQCLSCLKRIVVGNKKVYHYISNPNSAMRKGFSLKNELCALQSLDSQKEILALKGIYNNKSLEFHYMMVSYMILCGLVKNGMQDDYPTEMKKSIYEIKKRRNIALYVNLKLKDKIVWLLKGNFPIYMAKKTAIN